MNVLLSHFNLEPIIYGIIIILGIAVVIIHLIKGKIGAVILDIGIFSLVFWMHGGTMTGGMAAAVAALVGGVILPPIINYYLRKK